MDTSFSYTDLQTGYFSTDEAYWIRRVRKLAKEYPDDIQITTEPEENDGVLVAHIKPRLFAIAPKTKRRITPEESEIRRQRMKKLTDLQREQKVKKVKFE